MKKILCTCCVALLFMVSGCSDALTGVSDDKTALITIGDTKITKGDLYEGLKSQGATTSIINQVSAIIVEKEVPVTDEITKEAKESMETLKSYIGEEQWTQFLTETGYENEEAYFNDRVMLAARSGKITDKYLETDFTNIISKYKPMQVQVFETDSEEKATQALEMIQSGKEVKDVVTELEGITETYTGDTQILTAESGLPTNVWANVTKVTEANTVLDQVQFNLDLTSYFIVKVIEPNAENFKEAAIKTMATSQTIQNDAFAYFLNKYGFTIYDIDVYNAFKTQAPQYLVQSK